MEKFDMEALYEKVGGVFRLSVLVQKRMKELTRGAPKLVDCDYPNLINVIYQEIWEGKIELVPDDAEDELTSSTPSKEEQGFSIPHTPKKDHHNLFSSIKYSGN